MIINGKWMNEPEIKSLISQLTADKKRLEKQLDEAKRLLLLDRREQCTVNTIPQNAFAIKGTNMTAEKKQGVVRNCDSCRWRMR